MTPPRQGGFLQQRQANAEFAVRQAAGEASPYSPASPQRNTFGGSNNVPTTKGLPPRPLTRNYSSNDVPSGNRRWEDFDGIENLPLKPRRLSQNQRPYSTMSISDFTLPMPDYAGGNFARPGSADGSPQRQSPRPGNPPRQGTNTDMHALAGVPPASTNIKQRGLPPRSQSLDALPQYPPRPYRTSASGNGSPTRRSPSPMKKPNQLPGTPNSIKRVSMDRSAPPARGGRRGSASEGEVKTAAAAKIATASIIARPPALLRQDSGTAPAPNPGPSMPRSSPSTNLITESAEQGSSEAKPEEKTNQNAPDLRQPSPLAQNTLPSPPSSPVRSSETIAARPPAPTIPQVSAPPPSVLESPVAAPAPAEAVVRTATPLPFEKASSKTLKSRLRRALSFSSASALKTSRDSAYTTDDFGAATNLPSRGLYAQGGRASGSTDNLSISSTASSASVVLRKMGKGMKRGLNIFRKGSSKEKNKEMSAIDEYVAEASKGPVVGHGHLEGVNVDPHDVTGGGTHFPSFVDDDEGRPGLASLAEEAGEEGEESSTDRRKSLMLGERPMPSELQPGNTVSGVNAEENGYIASRQRNGATPKGILKNIDDPYGLKGTSFGQRAATPLSVPPSLTAHSNDSDLTITLADPPTSFSALPNIDAGPSLAFGSPAPSETNSTASSPTKSAKFPISYAAAVAAPMTPGNRGPSARIKFAPQITVFDTWHGTEYDRRGEIATCARLTPILAQRIKEELNAFKMDEMMVHEQSRVYTHFF
ncbi:bud neck involved protein [Saitoella coloradoensis]